MTLTPDETRLYLDGELVKAPTWSLLASTDRRQKSLLHIGDQQPIKVWVTSGYHYKRKRVKLKKGYAYDHIFTLYYDCRTRRPAK